MSTQAPTAPPKSPQGPPPPPSLNPLAAATVYSAIPAYGTLIQVLSASSPTEVYTSIAGVSDITGPNMTMAEVDVTSHSTGNPFKQTVPGLGDYGDLAFPCYWNPDDPTQNINSPYGAEYLFYNRIITKFQLVMPNAEHRTRQFKGFIKTMGEDYKVAGVCTRNMAIRIVSPLLDVASAIMLTPSENLTVPNAGAPTNTIQVTAGGNNAPWTAVPSDPWITITTPTAPQQGDGTITYAVAAGTAGTSRSGSITVTGLQLVFNITQMAS